MKLPVKWEKSTDGLDLECDTEYLCTPTTVCEITTLGRVRKSQDSRYLGFTPWGNPQAFPDKPSAKAWVEQKLGVETEEQGQAAGTIEEVADISGDGGYQYDLPSDWVEGFSYVVKVEYPAGKQVPVILEPGDYTVYKSPCGLKLHFYALTPVTGETIRLTYTAKEGQTSGH